MYMDKRESVKNYVEDLYCPVSMRGEMNRLLDFIDTHGFRNIRKSDSYRMDVEMLFIHTEGKGVRSVFKGYDLVNADFQKVSDVYAEAYVKFSEPLRNKPQRIFVKSNRYVIIDNQ